MRVISSKHRADPLRTLGHFDAEEILDRAHVGVLVAHHRDVIETIHVADRLIERLGLGELLGAAMQKADVRIGAHHGLAVHLEHETQHAVGRRMLRPEIQSCSSLISACVSNYRFRKRLNHENTENTEKEGRRSLFLRVLRVLRGSVF